MEPLYLKLENFFGHRLSEIDFSQFRSAVIVGAGQNGLDESNGVGKSTILHGIVYALYGQYVTDTAEEMIFWGADKCRITFDFQSDQGTFRIERSRSKKSGELLLYQKNNHEWKKITGKTPTETENNLKDLLKISYNAFKHSVFFAQSDLSGFEGLASSTDTGRRKILKEALDLLIYNKLEKEAKERHSLLNKEVISANAIIGSLGNPEKDLTEFEFLLEDFKQKNLVAEEKKIVALGLLDTKKAELLSFQNNIQNSSNKDKRLEISKNIADIKNKINTATNLLNEKTSAAQASAKVILNHNTQLNQYLSQLEQLKAKEVPELSEVEQEYNSMVTNEANGRALIGNLEKNIVKLKRPLPDDETCPHCRQILTPEHREACAKQLAEELALAEADLIKSQSRLENVIAKKKELLAKGKEIANHKSLIINLEQTISNKNLVIEHEIKTQDQISDLINHIRVDLESRKSDLAEEEKKLELYPVENEEIFSKIGQFQAEINNFTTMVNDLTKEINFNNTQIGAVSEKIKARSLDFIKLGEFKNVLKNLERKIYISSLVVQGYSPSGIPSMIINTILDELQIRANSILNEIRPGLELQFNITKSNDDGEVKDALSIIYRLRGKELKYSGLSGGQKLMINFALKLGLSLVIQERLGVNIKFIALDEVDQPLDGLGRYALVEIIKKIQDKFKILVITHNDYVKSKFQNIIMVTQTDQGSIAELCTNSNYL